MTEKENTMPLPQNYKDVSNQDLFKNHVLCAQFLRDYSCCKVFANVQPEDLEGMLNISGADINEIVKDSEENVLTIIRDVVYLLCRKMNLPAEETRELLTQLKEGRNMRYLFENMEHMDIQAERRERMQMQNRLEDAEKKLGDTEKKLGDTEKQLDDTERRLDDTEDELTEAYKSCLRLCKKHSRQREEAIEELLDNSRLTPETAREMVNRYWDSL